METLFVCSFIVCIALFFKFIAWRDEKRQQPSQN